MFASLAVPQAHYTRCVDTGPDNESCVTNPVALKQSRCLCLLEFADH